MNTAPASVESKTRIPLGQRPPEQVNNTVRRVVGEKAKAPVLEVAAFQSFAE